MIAVCRPKSPAAEAGLKPGDQIVEVDGRKISRSAEFREEINRRYAGDKLKLAVLRGKERIERELTLAEKIPPYQQPFLGVLPMRDGSANGREYSLCFSRQSRRKGRDRRGRHHPFHRRQTGKRPRRVDRGHDRISARSSRGFGSSCIMEKESIAN